MINNTKLSDKMRLRALVSLETIDPDKALEIATKLIDSPNKLLKTESVLFLACKNIPEGMSLYSDYVHDKSTYKAYLVTLPRIVEAQQAKSIDFLKELYDSGDDYTKLSLYRTYLLMD